MNAQLKMKIPDKTEVILYFFRMGLQIKHADAFFLYYQSQKWQIAPGRWVKNWKSLAFNWVCSFKKGRPLKGQQIIY